jgi:hypothetical protein
MRHRRPIRRPAPAPVAQRVAPIEPPRPIKATYVYDADLDCLIPKDRRNYFEPEARGPAIISDSLPGGINGIVHPSNGRRYDSKSRFRAETRARGLTEVGNDRFPARKPPRLPDPRPEMKRYIDTVTPLSRRRHDEFIRQHAAEIAAPGRARDY